MEEKREPLSEMAIERKIQILRNKHNLTVHMLRYRFFVISIWTVRLLLLSKAIMNMD